MEILLIVFWKISYADTNDHKSYQRSVFLNTNSINSIERVFVDIAIKKQKLFNNSKLFIPLRPFFTECQEGELKSAFKNDGEGLETVMNLYSIYREDQNGNEIDYSQFLSTLRGEKISINPNYSCINGRSISEEDLNKWIAWDNMPLRTEDFNFSSDDIKILKLFCQDAKILRKSHFLENGLPTLQFRGKSDRPFNVKYPIAESEKNDAYLAFRRLIMEGEKGCFLKAKKIVLDKRKNSHPIFKTLLSKGRKIDEIWRKQGQEIFFAKALLYKIPESNNFCWGKFINAVLNHGLFHQRDEDKTQKEYEWYSSVINSSLAFDALFYIGVHEIAKKICDFAGYIEDILNCLEVKINDYSPEKRKTQRQEDFEKYVLEKEGELVFLLQQKENQLLSYNVTKQRAKELLNTTFCGILWA